MKEKSVRRENGGRNIWVVYSPPSSGKVWRKKNVKIKGRGVCFGFELLKSFVFFKAYVV
jgi:hypothetical protein